MRWFLIVLAVLALAFAGAGCGGGDDESATDTDTTEITDSIGTDETTDETTTTDETDDTSTDGNIFAGGDCEELVTASQALGVALSGADSGEELEEASERFAEFAEEVPDEIRDDVLALAEVFEKYVSVFGDLDLQEGETPTAEQAQELAAALATIDQQAVSEAQANLTAWAQENC